MGTAEVASRQGRFHSMVSSLYLSILLPCTLLVACLYTFLPKTDLCVVLLNVTSHDDPPFVSSHEAFGLVIHLIKYIPYQQRRQSTLLLAAAVGPPRSRQLSRAVLLYLPSSVFCVHFGSRPGDKLTPRIQVESKAIVACYCIEHAQSSGEIMR